MRYVMYYLTPCTYGGYTGTLTSPTSFIPTFPMAQSLPDPRPWYQWNSHPICHLLSNLFPLHEIFYKISVLIVPITKGTYHVLSKKAMGHTDGNFNGSNKNPPPVKVSAECWSSLQSFLRSQERYSSISKTSWPLKSSLEGHWRRARIELLDYDH